MRISTFSEPYDFFWYIKSPNEAPALAVSCDVGDSPSDTTPYNAMKAAIKAVGLDNISKLELGM